MNRSIIPLCLLLSTALCPVTAAHPQTADKPAPLNLTPTQKREVNAITAKYRSARTDAEAKSAAVDKAIAYGKPAVSAMLVAVEQELHPQLAPYREKFMQAASGVYKTRVTGGNIEEIIRLRETVLGLRNRGVGFTKEAIVTEGDPAMARLRDIIIVGRDEVLARAVALAADRKRISELGEIWQRCSQYLHQLEPAGPGSTQEAPSFEEYLAGEEELAVGLAAPMSPQFRAVLAMNANLAKRIDPEEARAIQALNLTRNLLGLSPVVVDLRLCAAARDHSNDMKTLNFFAHESNVPGKAAPWDRAKRFGTTASAENIFMGSTDGRRANSGWFHSPGHHKNMLAKHRRVGVGRVDRHFTQLFGS